MNVTFLIREKLNLKYEFGTSILFEFYWIRTELFEYKISVLSVYLS